MADEKLVAAVLFALEKAERSERSLGELISGVIGEGAGLLTHKRSAEIQAARAATNAAWGEYDEAVRAVGWNAPYRQSTEFGMEP